MCSVKLDHDVLAAVQSEVNVGDAAGDLCELHYSGKFDVRGLSGTEVNPVGLYSQCEVLALTQR